MIQFCYSDLPIPYNSGGIVGSNSIIDTFFCINSGEILESYDPSITYLQSSNSGGIYGNNCSGTCTNCYNYGIINGLFSGDIIGGLPNNNFTLDSCYNFGNINGGISQYSAEIINSSPYKETFSISNCVNYGIVNNSCSGIINAGGIFGAWSNGSAQNCVNTGSIIDVSSGEIYGEFSTSVSTNCINSAHLVAVNSRNI